MRCFDLTPEEAGLLEGLLECTSEELRLEIRATDSRDFKEKLHAKRAAIQKLIGQLRTLDAVVH